MEKIIRLNNFSDKWLLTGLFLGILIGLIASIGTDLWGILFFLIFLLIVVIVGINSHNKQLFEILLFAFFIRVLLSVLHTYGLPLPDTNGDAKMFELQGWMLSNHLSFGNLLNPQIRELYVKIIALIYFFIGRVPLVIRLINAFMGSLIVANIYYIAKKLYEDRRIARIAALTTALFPALILYSTITMREVSAIFFISLSTLFFINLIDKKNYGSFVWSLIFFLISVLLHGAMALLLPAYIIFYSIYFFEDKSHIVFNIVIAISLLLVFWKEYPILFRKLPGISALSNWNYLTQRSLYASRGGAGYLKNFSVNSIFDVARDTPIRMIYFLFSPFPWMFHKLVDLFGFLDSACYILLVIFSLSGIKKLWSEKKKITTFILLSFLLFWIGLSWGTSNYGTAIRHRTFLVWILIPLAAYGITMFLSTYIKKINMK